MFPPEILHWGISVILAVQAFINPILTNLAFSINFTGTENFYTVALCLFFWCIDRRAAVALLPVFMLSDYAARVIKDITGVPRPYVIDPRVQNLDPQTDLAFPSEAVQTVSTFFLFLAVRYRRAWLWALAASMIVLIGLVRMYLGQHYPTDVLGAILFAVLFVLVLTRIDWRTLILSVFSSWQPVLLVALIPVVMAVVDYREQVAAAAGVLLGFVLGIGVEEKYWPFETKGALWKQVAKIVLGLGGALVLRYLLKPLFPADPIFSLVRYAIIGIWVAAVAPWLFIRLGVAGREGHEVSAPAGSVVPA